LRWNVKLSGVDAVLFFSHLIRLSNYKSIKLNFNDYFHISLSKASITSSIFSLGFATGCFFYGAISEKLWTKNVIDMRGI